MKKLYLLPLIICLLLLQNVAFAQNNPLMKSPLQTDVRQAQARSAESSVQLGYCDDVIASSVGLGKGITLPVPSTLLQNKPYSIRMIR